MKLLYDLFPILIFFVAYKLYDIYVATAATIVASFIQVAGYWFKNRRFETMHLVTLGLLVVLGGTTLILQDPLFIKWKPTLVNWLFAISFLGSQFFGSKTLVERMLSAQITLPASVWKRLNLAWIVFFIISGTANLYVAYSFDEATWVNFKLFGMMGLTLVFILFQGFYLARYMVTDDKKD